MTDTAKPSVWATAVPDSMWVDIHCAYVTPTLIQRVQPESAREIGQAFIDKSELEAIEEARADHATWGQVADAMGLKSPQAAQQRHKALAARVTRGVTGDEARAIAHRARPINEETR
jgi:hypothetical protein